MISWVLNEVFDQTQFLLNEKEIKTREPNVLKMWLVSIMRATDVASQHTHIVLVFKRIEQGWVNCVQLGSNNKHIRGQEAKRVFILTTKLSEQIVDEVLFVQNSHSILIFSKFDNKIHDGYLCQCVQQAEEILENLRKNWSCNFLAKSFRANGHFYSYFQEAHIDHLVSFSAVVDQLQHHADELLLALVNHFWKRFV